MEAEWPLQWVSVAPALSIGSGFCRPSDVRVVAQATHATAIICMQVGQAHVVSVQPALSLVRFSILSLRLLGTVVAVSPPACGLHCSATVWHGMAWHGLATIQAQALSLSTTTAE